MSKGPLNKTGVSYFAVSLLKNLTKLTIEKLKCLNLPLSNLLSLISLGLSWFVKQVNN